MAIYKNMRVGIVGSYPIPPEVQGAQRAIWLIERAKELKLGTMQLPFMPNTQLSTNQLKQIRDLVDEADIELEGRGMGTFELVGPNAQQGRERLLQGIAEAKALGSKIIRTGYGHLNVATSRFNREWPLAEHLGHLVANLQEAAKIVSDNGLLLAIENHCDFSGKQLAQVFAEVGSPNVGCALDTANPYTVYCDADEDCEILAPYAITTHMKDMVMRDSASIPELKALPFILIPMIATGVAVGDGNMDIPQVVKTLGEKSPHADGLHLIIETGWIAYRPDDIKPQVQAEQFHRSISYLNDLLQSLGAE